MKGADNVQENKYTLSSKEQRQVLKRLISYMKPHRKEFIIALFLLGLLTMGEVTGPYLIKIFIDDYIVPRNIDIKMITVLGVTYFIIQIANVVLRYIQDVKFQTIALKIIQQLRIDVFSKVQRLGMVFFDKIPAGSIVSRVTNDTEAIKEMFVSVLAIFLQSGFLLIGTYVAMFLLHPTFAFVCLLLLPIIYYLIKMYRRLSSKFYQELREALSQLNAKLNESLQGMSVIQVFQQEERMQKEFGEINERHYQAGLKNIKLDGRLLRPAVDLVQIFATMILLSYFGISSFYFSIEIGVLFAFITYLNRLFEPINSVMQQLTFLQQAVVSAHRVFKVLDDDRIAPQQNEETDAEIKAGKVEFKHVTFSYDGKQDVLKDVSFTVNPGETVAIVGQTGSGKSSIINLLMRFYEFNEGEILIDGRSIRDYPMAELRKKIGLVLQDSFMFYGTIKDNIRLYNREITDEQIEEAARFVQAHSFIEKLPDGYDQQVTERGTTLSSGQRQLIAFARTIVNDPLILVLDEATANIDTETEELIQNSLKKMREGRTTIAIAHRLSTIQDADMILVMHQGRIVERGNHQELLAQKGLYYKMYLLQNGLHHEIQEAIPSN